MANDAFMSFLWKLIENILIKLAIDAKVQIRGCSWLNIIL